MKNTTETELLQRFESRLRKAWADDPLFIEPLIKTGLTDKQIRSLEQASNATAKEGIPYYVAIVPDLPIPNRNDEGWGRFTSALALTMHEESKAEKTLVLFTQVEGGAKSFAYLVDDNGPRIPRGSTQLVRSASDDFLPVEVAVPYHLSVLVAAATGAETPPLPDYDTLDVDDRQDDYIEATGLDLGNPDGLVFGATAAAALGLTAWLFARRQRYSWRKELTTSPEMTRSYRLVERMQNSLKELPEPADADDAKWGLYERGRRIQEALEAINSNHPDWAKNPDFAHRCGVLVLTRTEEWIRRQLKATSAKKPSPEPTFCCFFPAHTQGIASIPWKQKDTTLTINACAECRAALNADHEPVTLMVPKNPGAKKATPVTYFQRDDAYAASGFGSFQDLEDAILAEAVRA